MRATIQRVSSASVEVDRQVVGEIKSGLLIFVGFEDNDATEDLKWMSKKIINLRVFNDDDGVMNRSVADELGELLVISQFTLHASTKKGNRPSYIKAAKPDIAIPIYENFLFELASLFEGKIERGIFGAEMKVSLVNEGPVTINIDSKNKE
ncbi:MAG: D-tyrosyl-tRNA(Tyr) deacylase [Chitinophagales bacterium]|nr:D-tyrosyl-tRNA(Tyr) deacylase [Chitinophagales bacterium]